MEANFAQSLTEVLKHEGGWADHPKDHTASCGDMP